MSFTISIKYIIETYMKIYTIMPIIIIIIKNNNNNNNNENHRAHRRLPSLR
jgi:hypothetical protein